jgi:hypothetical protein
MELLNVPCAGPPSRRSVGGTMALGVRASPLSRYAHRMAPIRYTKVKTPIQMTSRKCQNMTAA